MSEKHEALLEMQYALKELRAAWVECLSIFLDARIECNHYIMGTKENEDEYPFHASFDEIGVISWIDGCLQRMEKDIENIEEQYDVKTKRKVLFTDGMSNDFLLIITDAPKKDIEDYCRWHNQMMEEGGHFEMFASLKAKYYVKELLDSEVDELEDVSIIGHDVCYDFGHYTKLTERREGFRTVKITAGMTQEFEIISTDAPDSVIKANLQYINTSEETGEQIENPYAIIEAMGYKVNCLGCQDDFTYEDMKTAVIDVEFDFYDI